MPTPFASFLAIALSLISSVALAGDWSEEQISKLPSGEKAIKLFNGNDLSGWEGHIGTYFLVDDGVIVGKNDKDNAPKSSTYLLTQRKYRNFRLIFESQLVTSEMHSGIALWGQAIEKDTGPFTYQGHLVMYPSGYGYYDLFRRNSIYQDALGIAKRAGKQHDWNRMEILAIGRRIRHVVNGRLVADWSDPQPELCEAGPIGLQLHSNAVPQEVQWRGLILTENPQDVLVTADNFDAGLVFDGKPAESGMDEAALAKIDERMQQFARDKQISGAVTLVARRGRVVHLGAIGKADITTGRDMARDTLFAIASMTKPFTAVGVLILADEGKLTLDDPVSKYIPEFKETKLEGGEAPAREISVRDCLTHMSGLMSDQRNTGTIAKTAEDLGKSQLISEPGTKWAYGPGLSVAGRVIEVVSGKPYEEFLAERIFQPLEMKDTSFRPTPEQVSRLAGLVQPNAEKSDIEPGSHWLFDLSPGLSPNPSGGVFSTASDMAKFEQMLLNGGQLNDQRIVSADAVKQMTTVQTGDQKTGIADGTGWGLGFCIIREPQGVTNKLSPGTYGHAGAFGTQAWVDPQHEMVVVLMIARQSFPEGLNVFGELQRLAIEAIRD